MNHIAILGLGGVGGYLGGMLAQCYQNDPAVQISFICRGEHLQIIQKYGLHVKTPSLDFIAKPDFITDQPNSLNPVDFIFCCTKSYGLKTSLDSLVNCITPNTVFIPILNGIDSYEQIKNLFPNNPVWNACIYIVSRRIAPGEIIVSGIEPKLIYGTEQVSESEISKFKNILETASIPAFHTQEILKAMWEKYLFISPVASLSSWLNLTIGEFRIIPKHIETILQLINELKTIALKLEIPIDPNIINIVMDRVHFLPPETTSSMHTDFINNSETELESLTGHVVRLARSIQIPVPMYEKIYNGLKVKNDLYK